MSLFSIGPMPITRKLVQMGKTSRGVALPKSWLDLHEEAYGPFDEVLIEVADDLRIRPKIDRGNKFVFENPLVEE